MTSSSVFAFTLPKVQTMAIFAHKNNNESPMPHSTIEPTQTGPIEGACPAVHPGKENVSLGGGGIHLSCAAYASALGISERSAISNASLGSGTHADSLRHTESGVKPLPASSVFNVNLEAPPQPRKTSRSAYNRTKTGSSRGTRAKVHHGKFRKVMYKIPLADVVLAFSEGFEGRDTDFDSLGHSESEASPLPAPVFNVNLKTAPRSRKTSKSIYNRTKTGSSRETRAKVHHGKFGKVMYKIPLADVVLAFSEGFEERDTVADSLRHTESEVNPLHASVFNVNLEAPPQPRKTSKSIYNRSRTGSSRGTRAKVHQGKFGKDIVLAFSEGFEGRDTDFDSLGHSESEVNPLPAPVFNVNLKTAPRSRKTSKSIYNRTKTGSSRGTRANVQ